MPEQKTVRLVDAAGNPLEVPVEQAADLLSRGTGFRVETGEDVAAQAQRNVDEEVYGGAAGATTAAILGAARTATLGGSDVLAGAIGGENLKRQVRKVGEAQPVATIGGELAGVVIDPLGATSLATRAGAKAARAIEGSAVGSQIAGAAIRGGAEGAIFGAGQGVSEVALSEDPVTLERAASVISSNALFGAGTGGLVGAGAKGLELGLQRAKVALDRYAAKGVETTAGAGADVGADLKAFRAELKQNKLWLATKGAEEPEIRAIGRRTLKADRALDNLLDDPKALAESPKAALRQLRIQEAALDDLVTKHGPALRSKWASEASGAVDVAADTATSAERMSWREFTKGKMGEYMKSEGGHAGAMDRLAREWKDYKAGASVAAKPAARVSTGSRAAALDYASTALERNRGIQARITELVKPAATAPGTTVTEALGQAGLGYAVGAMTGIPFLGPAVLAAKAVGGVMKKLGVDGAAAAARSSKAIDSFLNVAAKAPPASRIAATKVLTSVTYGPSGVLRDKPKKQRGQDLATAYHARSQEIRELTAPGPDGEPVMRQEARARMAERLAPIGAVSPIAADRIETTKARAVEFLASKLPRKPDLPGMGLGPDRWQPSDMEMRGWARYVAAVEDPHGVVERLATGEVTPEDAEALQKVYPEIYAQIQTDIMMRLGELRAQLPYSRRLALSIFSGIPVDPTLDPHVLAALQGAYANEEGTEEGTQAPRAQPAFGSVSKPEPTAAQERGA